jgi:gamma-glutamylcyclotransferase (GGCT)/AIG2-like uncharacterized protein YtfP
MSGEPAHGLLEGASALGPMQTAPGYDLFDLGPHPALVAGGATAVLGELYELPASMLAAIDVYEEHPVLFKRTPIALGDSRVVQAYLLDRDQVLGRRRIASGDWRGRFRRRQGPSARDSAIVRWSKGRHRQG